jgi:hypothetical protein
MVENPWPADTYAQFRTGASERGMTPFEAFGSAVSVALARLTGQHRVMAATAASKRPAGADGIVGDFVISAMTPLDAREDVREALLEAKTHGITPFCITVDRESEAELRDLYGDVGYTIIDDVLSLPERLPNIYRRLTS